MKSSAESASSLNLVAVDDEILSVSAIATQTSTVSSLNYKIKCRELPHNVSFIQYG